MLHTKPQVPQAASGKLVARHELLECLNEGLNKRLTVITAPGGFGKTTSLSVWAQRSPYIT